MFQVSVFCVRYLQLVDKLLVSLKAGCECQFCTALCYFNVYPVNRAGTKITQITGTLLKWLWLLTQKCIYNEMLGILWTTRWYFWIYWKQTNLCLIIGIMMGYDLNLWWSQGCKQEHAWQNAKKTTLWKGKQPWLFHKCISGFQSEKHLCLFIEWHLWRELLVQHSSYFKFLSLVKSSE